MDSKSNWRPRPSDIQWTRDMIARLNDGAIWGIPANHAIYRLDKKARTFNLIFGPKQGPVFNLFEQIKTCCADPSIGYSVEEKLETITPELFAKAFKAEASGLGKAQIAIALGAPEPEEQFRRLMELFHDKPMKKTAYLCSACGQKFRSKVAHNCCGGHWSQPKEWMEVYE